MRAAIYARYSSDLQTDASIDDQVRLCRERLEQEGHELIEVFSDYAISGGHLKSRPGMMSLMARAREGDFEVVISEALDRISRDQEDIAAIFKRLNHADVKILTLSEGYVSELHIGLKGTMNALFLKDLADKTRRGQRGRVEAGKIPGGNSYGYQMVRTIQENGTILTGERRIDADQAAIVRRIFAEYVAGSTPRAIAARLNQEGVPSPRGGLWNASTINGSRQRRNGILNNDLYRGDIIYNRQRFIKDPETGKRSSRLNSEHLWVTHPAPHLRIIDEQTWDASQSLKGRYSSKSGNKRQTKKRLLTGLIKCGSCGGAMTIINRERYSCSARRERGTCNSPTSIAAGVLEERVLSGLRDILAGREDLIDAFATTYRAEINRLRKTKRARSAARHKELGKIERSIARCIAFITEGDGDPGTVRTTLADLEARKRAITHAVAAEPDAAFDIHPNIAELYRRKINELQTLFTDETKRPRAMEIVRSMIERIDILPGAKRGEAEVLLVGALASILDYASRPEQQNAAVGDGGVGRVLLVAGVGFEPTTFRL